MKECCRHVLPSFISKPGLDFRIQMVLSIGFECFECLKGVRLHSKREHNVKLSEVVYEGHSVAISRVSVHRERSMEIRVNKLKRASCLRLRMRKGIGMHLARQTGLANGIWSEFRANDKARYKLLRRHALNPSVVMMAEPSMPQCGVHRQSR